MRFYAVDHQPIGFWIFLNLQNGFRKREVIWHFGDQQGIPTFFEDRGREDTLDLIFAFKILENL